MSSSLTTPSQAEILAAKAFKEKVFGQGLAAMHLNLIRLGEVLGLFNVLVSWKNNPNNCAALTSIQLAEEANINARYCKEWCIHMTANGVLKCDTHTGTFELNEGIALALQDTSSICLARSVPALLQNPGFLFCFFWYFVFDLLGACACAGVWA